MNWRLRHADVADAAALALVAGASFLETFVGTLRGADIVAHVTAKSSAKVFEDWIAAPGSIVTIAQDKMDAPVGYTALVPTDMPITPGPADIELRRIYTLALTRGTGLGSALMARAIDDARAVGATRMLLGVHGGNRRAQLFYGRQGFHVAGNRRFLVGTMWCDDLIYARDL